MTSKQIKSSGIGILSATGGAIASRIVADKIPIENAKIKHGILAVAGMVGCALLTKKDATTEAMRNVAIGVSVAQVGALAKEFAGETDGIMKTALGGTTDNYFNSYEDFEDDENIFLSGIDEGYILPDEDEDEFEDDEVSFAS
ncbi:MULTISPECIES: hypothetical protein [Tenacibaculum]|uniref:Uncharacterized protein n=1 Tax=Tenacibaculum finnmarkense genomovar finnmarkense TaxID=1458503 RepID=A0AAP1WGQ6_9FLAO|nr:MULTISPECIES: hypothetical protein [Tenacibaculum]ALU75258.1 hypothetical protein AUW17_08285 [Tenacibaculum dicentrarchi]MBE7653244.1 hypothetical protein [Tenacibaculum finnmarkense genomovar finnmarkense]MBE7695545.1 hypothetical protein [Tenacibaculum finnmarkense genomovar finnmarkense]MCD8403629.1 hypothetical protein [Tenacibaculum finnmarkense genomovar finnmarkense]MCD8413465.1 hypothetical protein [Tenacibaculum finnmarkense genomovar ulcerans]